MGGPQIASVWSQMPAPHRRWIVVNALLATAGLNLVGNSIIAWLTVRGQEAVPLWGVPLVEPSIVWSVIATLFLLPLITCVLTTTAVRRDVRLGSLASLSPLRSAHCWLAALPSARLRRGVAFGAIAVAALAPPLILALAASSFPDLTKGQFVACQVAFAVTLGSIVTPVIALYAMADLPEGPQTGTPG